MLLLETLPPRDPSGGVVYLWIVLSPEQTSHLWMFLNISVLQGRVVSTSPNPQAGGPPLVGCPRLLIQFIRSYPPYRRPFLYPQPEDMPCRCDRDPLHGSHCHCNSQIVCESGFGINSCWFFYLLLIFCFNTLFITIAFLFEFHVWETVPAHDFSDNSACPMGRPFSSSSWFSCAAYTL